MLIRTFCILVLGLWFLGVSWAQSSFSASEISIDHGFPVPETSESSLIFRFGFLGGIRSTALQSRGTFRKEMEYQEQRGTISWGGGLLLDFVFPDQPLSLHTEVAYRYLSRSAIVEAPLIRDNLVINHHALDIPFLVRWTQPVGKWEAFGQLGPQLSLSVRTESTWYQYDLLFSSTLIEVEESQLLKRPQWGVLGGLGIAYPLSETIRLFGEARYGWLRDFQGQESFLSQREPQFIIGISF
jgi:hypothetical protein